MTVKSWVKNHRRLYVTLAPLVRFVRYLQPRRLRFEQIKRRCFRQFERDPIIEIAQSGIVSRFHAISAKNYWHLYINRDEMNCYIGDFLRPNDCVLDIGGHVGAYTVPIAKYVGKDGHVDVFEPEDEGRAAIKRNLDLNGITNTTIHDVAVGEQDGTIDFFIRPEKDTHSVFELSNAPSPTGILIKKTKTLRSVDSLVQSKTVRQPQFIKLDVEGAELLALEGMKDTLRQTRAIFVECHDALRVDLHLGDPVPLVTEKLLSLGATRVVMIDENHVIGVFNYP